METGIFAVTSTTAHSAEQAKVKHGAVDDGARCIQLFNGYDLAGWDGQVGKYWSVKENCIRGANDRALPVSTYLFTKGSYRNFRLRFEVKQTIGPAFDPPMHSAVAAFGQRITDRGEAFGFKGLLLMFCGDWGIWDAHGRNRIYPPGRPNESMWEHRSEKFGDWNHIEVLALGNRIRLVNNGMLVVDFQESTGILRESPIGLQLHSNIGPQEYLFRGLVLTERPSDELFSLSPSSLRDEK